MTIELVTDEGGAVFVECGATAPPDAEGGARQREKSHVDRATLEAIREFVETVSESAIVVARQLVPELTEEQLAQVLADWLDVKGLI